MERRSFIFYASYFEAANILKVRERDALYKAIVEYGLFGTEPQLKGTPLACWLLIKPQLDANNRKYQNGKRGGRSSKSALCGSSVSETTGSDAAETKPKPNGNENDNVNENENVNETAQQRPAAPPQREELEWFDE